MIIGVDTGGTFTDFIYNDGNTWGVYKLLSTPGNPAEAVISGISHLCGGIADIVHGSTVATNAILEKKGADCALITNSGFEDILEIGRQNRNNIYNLRYHRNKPLIKSNCRFGIECRVDHNGNIINPIDKSDINRIVSKIKERGIKSVAVSFLFSFKNPNHELITGKILKDNGFMVSLSHVIVAEFREYERTSTTVINAYVMPLMKTYINDVASYPKVKSLHIMQSNGGSISAQTAMNEPVKTILSGPAGGVGGAYNIAAAAGLHNLITFDMGGTSTDVSLLESNLPIDVESNIAGYPVKTPVIDIHTVGAGGGSIAYLDDGGALKVGPRSAGANPGPICYGSGEEITVTDANLYLGRLMTDQFLGGRMKLETKRLDYYFNRLAKAAGIGARELAEGIIDIANGNMEKAIRVISVEKGYDPSKFTLFAFGGAGGMHAAYLAHLLHIHRIMIPKNSGILSAIGMLLADIIKDYSETVMKHDITANELAALFKPLEQKAISELYNEGVFKHNISLNRFADIRYIGQSYEIIVPFSENFVEDFHKLHKSRYGYSNTDKAVEVVNIRVRAIGKTKKPEIKQYDFAGKVPDKSAFIGQADAIFDGKSYETNIVSRNLLSFGNRIDGPAIVVEYSSTTVLPPFTVLTIDRYDNMIIEEI